MNTFFLPRPSRAFLVLSKNTHRMKKIKLSRTIYTFSAFLWWAPINFLMVVRDSNHLQSFKTPSKMSKIDENVENWWKMSSVNALWSAYDAQKNQKFSIFFSFSKSSKKNASNEPCKVFVRQKLISITYFKIFDLKRPQKAQKPLVKKQIYSL